VHAEIVKKFGENAINVKENNFNNSSSIIVTFFNSSLNDKTNELRALRAQETAEIVKARYPSIVEVDEIWVVFMRQTTRFLVITFTESVATFGFDRNARSLDDRAAEPSALTARTNYIQATNETEISLALVLEGSSTRGLNMFPHFTLKGDAPARQLPPPKIVTFDFASYAPTRRFQPDTTLSINVDNETIYEKEVTFSASKAPETGQIAEFLYLSVPYDEFRQIGNGTDVTISIGTEKFTLKREQVIALKNMNAYVNAAARQRR